MVPGLAPGLTVADVVGVAQRRVGALGPAQRVEELHQAGRHLAADRRR